MLDAWKCGSLTPKFVERIESLETIPRDYWLDITKKQIDIVSKFVFCFEDWKFELIRREELFCSDLQKEWLKFGK